MPVNHDIYYFTMYKSGNKPNLLTYLVDPGMAEGFVAYLLYR